jgi:hypothetical protein
MTAVLTRMLHAIDSVDFVTIRASFTDPVETDYVSLWGGTAESVPLDKLIGQWQEFLAGFGATQHQTGDPTLPQIPAQRASAG